MFPYTQHLGLETKKKLWLILQCSELWSVVLLSLSWQIFIGRTNFSELALHSDTFAIVCLLTDKKQPEAIFWSIQLFVCCSSCSLTLLQSLSWVCCIFWLSQHKPFGKWTTIFEKIKWLSILFNCSLTIEHWYAECFELLWALPFHRLCTYFDLSWCEVNICDMWGLFWLS